jgi:hypothetical protein
MTDHDLSLFFTKQTGRFSRTGLFFSTIQPIKKNHANFNSVEQYTSCFMAILSLLEDDLKPSIIVLKNKT